MVGAILGCDRRPATPAAQPPSAEREVSDSLVLSGSSGVEVWYTLLRQGHRPDGSRCTERGLEIRRGNRRTPVPLLYTGEKPTLLNDSIMRAVLWTNCRPGDVYLVNLKTGHPVRQGGGAQE